MRQLKYNDGLPPRLQ